MTTNRNDTVNSARGNTLEAVSRISRRTRFSMFRRICLAHISLLLTVGAFSPTLGQEAKDGPDNTHMVTASVISDGVRIAAPSAVVQLRLEVYDDAGQKLFDTEQRGGNVLDWHLKADTGGRVANGTYLCVVTIKNPSGRLGRKLGVLTVAAQSTTMRSASIADVSPLQAQVVGPIKGEDEGLEVMPGEGLQPVTVVAHTGDEAQLTRTQGALTFRSGDFFSGNDKEQMRLTEDGNLGLGTTKPKAKLDVAGVIRAREGFMFSDGSMLKLNEKGVLTRTTADGPAPSLATTSQERIAKFTDNAGTLGDSVITESAGLVGIGTSTPTQALEVSNGRIATTGSQTLTAPGGILEIGTTVTNNDNGASGFRMRNTFNGSASVQQALDVAPTFAPSASVSLARGFISTAFFAPPAGVTITDGFGGNANTVYSNTSGAVTNGTGFAIRSPLVFGALKPTTQYGLRINNQGIAGTNTSYGLFVDAQSGSNNNYSAIFAGGNVGIGTTNPSAKLEVAGNLKLSGANGSLTFPDGTSMTTAAGSTASGTSIINAVNDAATTGTINDSRLSPNLARLNNANTFGASQTVNGNVTATGRVESNSGGFRFPDGSVQSTAATGTKAFTTVAFNAIEIGAPGSFGQVLQLDLPAGSYMVTASLMFENRGLFNKRLVECQIVNEAVWFARIEGQGGAMDHVPVTIHTVTQGGTIRVHCGAIDGGTGHSNIFLSARRLTAIKLDTLVTQ